MKMKMSMTNFSGIDIEGIRTVFVLYFFYERSFKYNIHKQKRFCNIQPNISIRKKNIYGTFNQIFLSKKYLSNIQPDIFKIKKASKLTFNQIFS